LAEKKIDAGFLIKRAQAGDKKAFEQLVLSYQERVYALSFRLAGNHTDAQDLAQEAFVKAYQRLGSFRGEADFGTWLHKITVNTWLNIKRQQKEEPLSLDEPLKTDDGEISRTAVSDDVEGDPEESFARKELQELVWKALNSLNEEFRVVIVLREMEGYSYEEIASMMNCSLGTVKSRLNRARRLLREKVTVLLRESEAKETIPKASLPVAGAFGKVEKGR